MAKKLPFEKIFPYFSYRWRYDDGQYSPYAPFTQSGFISKEPDIKDFFKKGHNTSVANELKTINIKNIPKGGPDVAAVDLLYRESISTTVYILKTFEIEKSERGDGQTLSMQLNKRAFSSALPDNQLSRHFDNVPLKAKAQEVTANRLMYGNYVQKYDILKPLDIKISTEQISQPNNGPSVKSNRTYEVGVVYLDKYGRHSSIQTQKQGQDDQGSSFSTDFVYSNRIQLSATINSVMPSWATHYKYYVKDTSNEHFNLTAFNSYNDGGRDDTATDNIYLQFNSSDRNKITDDTILIPRRHDFGSSTTKYTTESRHPVLHIENEAPDIVKAQVNERTSSSVGRMLGGSAQTITSLSNDAAASINVNATAFFIKDANGDTWNGPFQNFILRNLNEYILSQDNTAEKLEAIFDDPNNKTVQTIDVSGFADRLVVQYKDTNNSNVNTDKVLVDEIQFGFTTGNSQRNSFKFTVSNRVNDKDEIQSTTGFSKSWEISEDSNKTLQFYKMGLSEEGQDKLKGSFFVKVPRQDSSSSALLPIGQTSFDEEGKVDEIKQINFEVEPIDESNLDLYWESSKVYSKEDHGKNNRIEWSNCIATKDLDEKFIYLESTKIFDKFNTVQIAKGTRVITSDPRYAQEHRKSGIIFSGLYNSKTGVNELNQFIEADGITKELEPNYGGIQKLYTLDSNLLAFAEDKVFKVQADKDILFNADEGLNVVATSKVLGFAQAYQGNYGISTHPESLVYFNNQLYFTDAKRGVVMQLTPANGQLFPISSRGMSNFFRDRLHTADKLIGMYDGAKKIYVLSLQGYDHTDPSIGSELILNESGNLTLGYSPRSESWPSRFSFIPENGLTKNNKFYTFKDGKAYLHHDSSVDKNTFYDTFTDSHVEIVFNDNPSSVKEFLTLSYEGTSGWTVSKIDTESEDAALTSTWPFVKKEDKYFAPIVSQENYYGSTDQSLGSATADDGSTVYIQGTRDKSGIKGFYNKVRLENDSTSKAELFAVNAENFISQT